MNIKDLIKDFRIIIFLVALILSIGYLYYAFTYSSVIVKGSEIIPNNSVIYEINGCTVKTINDIYRCSQGTQNLYTIKTSEGVFQLNSTEFKEFLNSNFSQISILKFGVDIAGGYIVVLKPSENISSDQARLAANVLESRLNSYGIKAINFYYTPEGYIIIQIPYSESDIIGKLLQQGIFEAKIGNQTIFTGSDIVSILSGPQYAGITGCQSYGGKWICTYRFGLIINQQAAQRFAEATKNLSIIFQGGSSYLSEQLTFYLDGKNVSTLNIAADLRGKAVTDVSISVSGVGDTRNQAARDAMDRAKQLEVILANGQLPSQYEISNVMVIPSIIGRYILDQIIMAAVFTLITIFIILFISYREVKISLLLYFTMLSEFIISLAILIAIGLVLDISAILGILIGMVTGIDDQLVAVEEIKVGRKEGKVGEKINKARFIIMVAILLEIISVFPFFVGGFGLLKGFATALIITAIMGYFVTRPAFIKIAEKVV